MTFVYSEAIKTNYYVQLEDLPPDTIYYAGPLIFHIPSLDYSKDTMRYSKNTKWYEDIESMGAEVFNFIEEQKQQLADPAKGMMSESEYKDKYKNVDQNQNQAPYMREYWELDLVKIKIDEEDPSLSPGDVNVRVERDENGRLSRYVYRYRYNYERYKEEYPVQHSAKPITLIKYGIGAAQVLKVSKNLDDFPQSLHATLPKTSSECAEGWYYVNATYMPPEKYSEYQTKLAEVNASLKLACDEYMAQFNNI